MRLCEPKDHIYEALAAVISEQMSKVETTVISQIAGASTDQDLTFDITRRNESVERQEQNKIKKLVIKEMQLLRLREPNMRKKEYQERLRQLEETQLDVIIEKDGRTSATKKEKSPEAILRKILLENTKSISPLQSSENTSLMLFKGSSSGSRAQTQLFSRPALKTVEHKAMPKPQIVVRQVEKQQSNPTYLTEISNIESTLEDQVALPALNSTRINIQQEDQESSSTKEAHQEFIKRMKRQKQLMQHKKQKSLERVQQIQYFEQLRQMENERIQRDERERSLEAWREQVRQKIEERAQQRYQQQEPLKSLYTKNPNLVITEQIKKKREPLYVLLGQQFEQQQRIEEREYQAKLRKIKEERKPVRLDEIRQHERSIDHIIAQRNEERQNQRNDAYLSHLQLVKGAQNSRHQSEYSRRVKQQINMEKQAEDVVKREMQKLYHKKINYGHKVMELYKPDPNTQKMMDQRDRVNELRKKLAIHHSKVPSLSDYMDSRQQRLNVSETVVSKTKAAQIRSSMIQHQISKESLYQLDRDNSLDSLKILEQRNINNQTSFQHAKGRLQPQYMTVSKQKLDSINNKDLMPMISHRSNFNQSSTQQTPINRGHSQLQFDSIQKGAQNIMIEWDNVKAGNRQSEMPLSLPKNSIFDEIQVANQKRNGNESLMAKISVLQQSDVL